MSTQVTPHPNADRSRNPAEREGLKASIGAELLDGKWGDLSILILVSTDFISHLTSEPVPSGLCHSLSSFFLLSDGCLLVEALKIKILCQLHSHSAMKEQVFGMRGI